MQEFSLFVYIYIYIHPFSKTLQFQNIYDIYMSFVFSSER